MPETMTAVGVNLDDLKRGLKRLLTVAEPIARLTPTPIDDAAVAFLKLLLADDARLTAAAVG